MILRIHAENANDSRWILHDWFGNQAIRDKMAG